jgi:hypothetical protein
MTKPVEPWVAEMAFEEHRNAVQLGEVEPNPAQIAAARAGEAATARPQALPEHAVEAEACAGRPAPSGEAASPPPDPQAGEPPGPDQPSQNAAAQSVEPEPEAPASQDELAPVGFQGMEAESISWHGDEPEAQVADSRVTTAPPPSHPLQVQTDAAPAPEAGQSGTDGAGSPYGLPELAAFRIQFDPDLVPTEAPEFTPSHLTPPPIAQAPAQEASLDPQARPGDDPGMATEEDMSDLGFQDILRAVEEGQPLSALPNDSFESGGDGQDAMPEPAATVDNSADNHASAAPSPEPGMDDTPQQDVAPVPDAVQEESRPDIEMEDPGTDFEPQFPSEENAPPQYIIETRQEVVDQQAREVIKRSRVSGEKSGLAAKWKAFRSKKSDNGAEE